MSSSLKKVEDLLGIEPIHWAWSRFFGTELFKTVCGIVNTIHVAPEKIGGYSDYHKITCLDCLRSYSKFPKLPDGHQNIIKHRIRKLERVYDIKTY